MTYLIDSDGKTLPFLPVENDEKVEEKGTKILAPNTLSTRRPVLLAQIKPRSNSYKLKNQSERYYVTW